jgi:hypothetical protein
MLGRSADNTKALIVYFIMGRSVNSRNRVFAETEDGIKTQAHDPSKMTDPSLVIYHPVRRVALEGGTVFIVTNGDQTDTLRDYLTADKSYADALATREFEPDPPNYTPRISGLLYPSGEYMLSILKSLDSNPACCQRHFFTYDAPLPGTGHFICTYTGDGDPLPSYEGEPKWVEFPRGNIEDITDRIWQAMDPDNKVSLFVCEAGLDSGDINIKIKNKNRDD